MPTVEGGLLPTPSPDRPMRRSAIPFLTALLLAPLAACGLADEPEMAVDADTLTKRQHDSIVSTFPIPGAAGIGRAIDASDAAAEREKRLNEALGGN